MLTWTSLSHPWMVREKYVWARHENEEVEQAHPVQSNTYRKDVIPIESNPFKRRKLAAF